MELNTLLTHALPEERWRSVAVIWHGNIAMHQDLMDHNAAYMIALTDQAVTMEVGSEAHGHRRTFAVSNRLKYFDPTFPHSILVDAEYQVMSLVLYSPARR
eukprot:2040884-Amphidinium_carterae.1